MTVMQNAAQKASKRMLRDFTRGQIIDTVGVGFSVH